MHHFIPVTMYKSLAFFFFLFSFFSIQTHAQCISGNCINGKGTYVYPSGAKYLGDFKNGEISGVGVCYYTDGSKYSGEWRSRYPDGKGTKTYADGTKRTGSWRKGKPVDATGKIQEEYIAKKEEEQQDDGTNIQSGCLSGNCQTGIGVFAYPDGSKYEGAFAESKFNGQGAFYFANGDKYTGAFKDNFPEGQGVRLYADGRKDEGAWREGEFRGSSLIDGGKTGCIDGDCTDGNGIYVYKEGSAKFAGAFVNGMPNGKGECLYANGDRYSGDWAEGAFNGRGILYKHEGSEVSGYWRAGEYLGKEDPDIQQASEPVVVRPDDTPVAEPADAKVWAVVVGVAAYNHMPVLRYTDDDAYRFYAFLKSLEGGALPDNQVSILIDEEATRENIVETMKNVFAQVGPQDLVVFYFSGHGLNGSFLPIDFDGFNNKITHEEIAEMFNGCRAKYKLCLADACHSGSLFAMRSGEEEPVLNQYYKTLAKSVSGTALIMSSKADETSLESAGLRQGVFSHFLIRGLKGEADTDKDKVVSIAELYEYIFSKVRDYTGNRQSPVIKGSYDPKMTVSVVR